MVGKPATVVQRREMQGCGAMSEKDDFLEANKKFQRYMNLSRKYLNLLRA